MSSDTKESPPSPATSEPTPPPPATKEAALSSNQDLLKDILLWRKKVLNIVILLSATAIWVLLDVYQFNFITVSSWAAMFVVAASFFLGNINRLLAKEPPNMSGMEIDEQSATKMAHTFKEWVEECGRWMFRVGAEREWYEFAGVEACLYLLSLLAKCFDFLTLVFIGVVLGLSVPVMYMKYEYKIKEIGQRLRMQCRRYYDMINAKLIQFRHKMVREDKVKKED